MTIKSETKITVYTQTGCFPCTLLKDWLNENKITFNEKNIKENPQAREEFNELGLEFTPYTFIRHKGERYTVAGIAPTKFKRILSI